MAIKKSLHRHAEGKGGTLYLNDQLIGILGWKTNRKVTMEVNGERLIIFQTLNDKDTPPKSRKKAVPDASS